MKRCEYVLVSYFGYIAMLAAEWKLPAATLALAFALPLVVTSLALAATRYGGKVSGVVRELTVPAAVLIAYQELRWFERPPGGYALERRWVLWDRMFLDGFHGRQAIESLGAVIPFLLDLSYLLVYAIPPVSLALLYRYRRRSGVDQFLFTLLLGTLFTYALLPFFPTSPPRSVFPGQDLPAVHTILGRLNVWMLDHYDIHTSVFPSGHVTAAFSAAFGMLLALPERKTVGLLLLLFATSIAITTVYGRYHYLADGAAGLLISMAAAGVSAAVFSPARDATPAQSQSVRAAHAGN